MKIRRALTLDNRTSASNPGRAPVNMLRYAWFYPSWPLVLAISFLFSAFLVAKVSLWFLILLFPVLAFGFLYWIRIKEFFARGDANPGVVIQLDPTLVAVATDLSHSGGSYPAIKVFRTRLRWIMGEKVGLGTRLPTVALYTSSLDPKCPHWADFDPRPLECATGNRRVLNRVMHSFLERDWQRLEASVQRLPVAQPGLYQLRAWPKLPDIPAEHISEDEFWQIIENTKAPAKSEQIELLKGELQRLPNDQLVGFRSHFMRRKLAAYNWDLWLVALLGQGGFCSDDGFADFLNWLISQGRAAYQCGLDDPDSLIEQIHAAENPRFESFGYVPSEIFRERTGRDFPELDLPYAREPSGGDWLRAQLKDRTGSKLLNRCIVFRELGDEEFTAIQSRFPRTWEFCVQKGIIKTGETISAPPSEAQLAEEFVKARVDPALADTDFQAYLKAVAAAAREYNRNRMRD